MLQCYPSNRKSHLPLGLTTGWAWIFILEGLFTVVIGIISYFVIQDFPETAKFLSETERMYIRCFLEELQDAYCIHPGVFIIRRLQSDMKFSAAGEKFYFKYVLRSLKDWKTWVASTYFHNKYPDIDERSGDSGTLHGVVS